MRLIEEIIEILTLENSDLQNALLKTKVLLHRLGESGLVSWVNSELNGYQGVEQVPEYRIINVTVFGNVSNRAYRYSEQPLPLGHLEEEMQRKFTINHLTDSIAVLESYAKNDTDLSITIAPEFYSLLSQGISGGYQIERAWGKPSLGAMLQVVTEVRSRLLDFILELSERIPEEPDISEMKEKSKEIGTSDLFKNAVFGDNATVVVGSHNIQSIQNSIIKNSFDSLAEVLRKHSVDEEDISALKDAIEKDQGSPEHLEKKYGQNVRAWISSMLTKATESIWTVNLGVASSLLANALNCYYGWF